MKKIKIGLLPRIIIAIILGIAIGTVFPAPLVRIFVTFNGIFSEFLNFSIPLIIVGLVTVAIADIGKGAGKMLLVTALIAYGATLFSGFLSYFTGVTVFPSLIEPGVPLEEVSEAQGILPYFSVSIPPLMNVMTALIFAFTLGLGLASLNSDALKNVARDFQEIIVRMISAVILPLLPLYIFGIFLNMTHSGQVYAILMVFIKIIGVIFILHIFLLVFQYSIAALFVRKNPFKLLGKMMPAYFTALGTQSSAATIPVTLEQTKKNGVSSDIAGFVIPLCATIHLSGSTLKIVACALALMMMQGIPFDFPLFAGFIFMLGSAYSVISDLRAGIWDRHLKANTKTNAAVSVVGGVAVFVWGLIKFAEFGMGVAVLQAVIMGGCTWVLCFALLQLSMKPYKKRHAELENPKEDDDENE